MNISSIQQPYFLMNTSEIDTEVRMAVDFEILVREKVRPKSETGPLTVKEIENNFYCEDQLKLKQADGAT